MEQIGRHAAQLVDDVNPEVACEAVEFLLRLRIASQSGRLQAVRHEKPVSRVQRSAAVAEVLRGMVRLRRGTVAFGAEVGLREGLHDHGEGTRLADPTAAEPNGSVVVRGSGHWKADSGFVGPRVESPLQGQREQRDGVHLLLRALGVFDQLQGDGGGASHGQGQRHELRNSRLSSAAGNGLVIGGCFYVLFHFRGACLLFRERDGLLLQGDHVLVFFAVALNPAGGRGGREAKVLRQQGVVGCSKVLEVEVCLALAGFRGNQCDILLLQTAGDSLRDVLQNEAGDFFRRNVVVVAVGTVIGSAAYVDELHLSALASLAIVAIRVGVL